MSYLTQQGHLVIEDGKFHFLRAFSFPLLFLAVAFGLFSSPSAGDPLSLDFISYARLEDSSDYFVGSDIKSSWPDVDSRVEAPMIAYLIHGTKGDAQRMRRTLQAVYHPRNQYILHLDFEAPPRERIELATWIKTDPTFREVENNTEEVEAKDSGHKFVD